MGVKYVDGRQTEAEQKYIAGGMTLRALAEETGIPFSTISRWSKAGSWTKKREKFQKRALRKAATRAVDKRAKELAKLLEASGEIEEALLLAARAFRAQMISDETGEKVTDGKTRAANLSSVTHALGRQAETRMLLSGILTMADREKLELLRRKQDMEERREQAEQLTGGLDVRLIVDPDEEEMLDAQDDRDSHAGAEPAAEAVSAEP